MSFLNKIIKYSSAKEPFAGGSSFSEQLKASLPFLKLVNPKHKKVLVIGCGEGYEVKWFDDNNFETVGITKEVEEAKTGRKKYKVKIKVADMHKLPFQDNSFDTIYASNVLEHSIAPFVALLEWRRVLKKDGRLVVVMPSKEWIKEYYHYSVLTHSQTKDLLFKTGFRLLAGPEHKASINLNGGDIFYDLGRGWGHYDGYVAQKIILPKNKIMLGKIKSQNSSSALPVQLIKVVIKKPFNIARIWYARNHNE